MRVILAKDIPGVGKKGEVKNVSPGYFRNYLKPNRLATIATQEMIERLRKTKEQEDRQYELAQDLLKTRAREIEQFILTLKAKADDDGTLYGSIRSHQISEQLKSSKHWEIKSDNITLDEPLKTIGEYIVTVDFGNNIIAPLKVIIEKDNNEK